MQGKALGTSLIVVSIVVLALGVYMYAFSTSTQNGDLTIDPSSGMFAQLELSQGERVHGSMNIVGESHGIKVFVESPSMEVVYNGGTVYNSLEFSFNAQNSGVYIVNFENLSPSTQQSINYSLTHDVYPDIIKGGLIIAGALLFVSGTVSILLTREKPFKQHKLK